jgi:hypothetical protein
VPVSSFGGVGATIAYSENVETEHSEEDTDDYESWLEVGLQTESDFYITTVGLHLALQLGYERTRGDAKTTGTSTVVARQRSFVLGDADDGDVFDVQVVCIHQTALRSVYSNLDLDNRCFWIQHMGPLSSTL